MSDPRKTCLGAPEERLETQELGPVTILNLTRLMNEAAAGGKAWHILIDQGVGETPIRVAILAGSKDVVKKSSALQLFCDLTEEVLRSHSVPPGVRSLAERAAEVAGLEPAPLNVNTLKIEEPAEAEIMDDIPQTNVGEVTDDGG